MKKIRRKSSEKKIDILQINYVPLHLIMPFWNIWHVKIYLQWSIIYGKYGLGCKLPMLYNTLTVAEWANLYEGK